MHTFNNQQIATTSLLSAMGDPPISRINHSLINRDEKHFPLYTPTHNSYRLGQTQLSTGIENIK